MSSRQEHALLFQSCAPSPAASPRRSQDLVEQSRGHRKIILYAVPGKEPFYRKFGFLRMKTAMAIFANQRQQVERGYLSED